MLTPDFQGDFLLRACPLFLLKFSEPVHNIQLLFWVLPDHCMRSPDFQGICTFSAPVSDFSVKFSEPVHNIQLLFWVRPDHCMLTPDFQGHFLLRACRQFLLEIFRPVHNIQLLFWFLPDHCMLIPDFQEQLHEPVYP